jgi:hypothetical protein
MHTHLKRTFTSLHCTILIHTQNIVYRLSQDRTVHSVLVYLATLSELQMFVYVNCENGNEWWKAKNMHELREPKQAGCIDCSTTSKWQTENFYWVYFVKLTAERVSANNLQPPTFMSLTTYYFCLRISPAISNLHSFRNVNKQVKISTP